MVQQVILYGLDMWVVMIITMGLLDTMNKLVARKVFGKRLKFDRSIETCSHLPKSEVVGISLIILRQSIS